MKYLPRLIDSELEELMEIMGAVLIEGCKWCGKSTTATVHAKSVIEFQDPDKESEYESIAKTQPSIFLIGEKPRLFDEWQTYPVVWDSIRTEVDHSRLKGQYILTGSALPKKKTTKHTGTGRIGRLKMRTMSLYESLESTGEVSLDDIVRGKNITGVSKLSLEELASIIVRGGWPASLDIKSNAKYRIAKEYIKSLVEVEVSNVDGTERNPEKMMSVLRSLARNVSSQVTDSTIENDVKNNFDESVSRPTVIDYVNTLHKLFVIENVNATNLNFRSKYAMRVKPKKYFVDPSLAAAVLEMGPADLLNDLNTFGFLFECLCIRDLLVYTQSKGWNLSFYRDEKDFEVDAILRTSNGRWGAVEIKLGSGYIDEAAENLLKFTKRVDVDKCGEPLFLMVLTGTTYSYKRDDGVYVVSIGTLKD